MDVSIAQRAAFMSLLGSHLSGLITYLIHLDVMDPRLAKSRNAIYLRKELSMEINGIAHITLTAGDFERSVAFYRELLPFLGLKPIVDTDDSYYCVGGRTGIAVRRRRTPSDDGSFDQNRVGLHHLCFRARTRQDVDDLHVFLQTIHTTIIRAPREDNFIPGYYSMLFKDPDGIRLEINHVPGRGVLEDPKDAHA
jgi:catechol 2,3-dioxygenase-like lactoylglutathione lyase family enzyme